MVCRQARTKALRSLIELVRLDVIIPDPIMPHPADRAGNRLIDQLLRLGAGQPRPDHPGICSAGMF